jgi:hypothetical protein
VFENRLLRRIFGPKRDEVTRGWRKLHNEEPEGKRPLGRRRLRWVDNIKMDRRDIDGVVWSGLISLRIGTNGGFL